MQPVPAQEVAGRNAGGIGAYQLDHGGAGNLRGERLAELAKVLLLGLAAASRVGTDRRGTEFGERREPRQHGRKRDAQTSTFCLVLRIARDEALGGLGAGVPTA